MKKMLFVAFMALIGLRAFAQAADGDIVKVGDKMPAFTVTSDKGVVVNSASLKGKVVLINFFATWCPPCQKELAEIQKTLWPAFHADPNFEMLVVGREHNSEELLKYNEKKGFTFPLYTDKNRAVYGSFAKNLIPRTYLVNKEGVVIYATKGYTDEEFKELMQHIRKALGE